ncbi:MAG: PspC domain-containing protein [Acidobacteria bacterium RIFCSPLOWO2_12_FULL_54_10]|nr:MAG: PspC domain-containing protein [Acidobacteria bacterium RIFCSPLOWO2_12_FULL_54_10]
MKRLYRSQTDKKIAGIFGGIAELYNIDPSLLRLTFVFLGLATGIIPLLISYFVGWIIIPKGPASGKLPQSTA